ncbi:hypothetical protein QUB80_06505 [Chlorogloeopsis sp. ULAP01]|uniref:hypothetical protein n=1 Tax=Chlorogloeopsis sp. ULAP01 TaxID=3056483 RepID=UPI0025AA9238|nr:hypothetical protein [Chlorogloeopsis sp. ULAP01]MDM9380352.1 hypothetical protein [Chlorogloeopsis sp. ULAP01]
MNFLIGLTNKTDEDRVFRELYKIDDSTNLYMIEIALDQYTDIFNEWDPAPFKHRELDPELRLYLEESSNEIPSKYPIELCFTVPVAMQNEQIEDDLRDSLKNSFIYKRFFLRKEVEKTNKQMLLLVVVGFVCLWVANTISTEADLQSILLEGLAISGWVFIWEAVSLFFFTNRELYHRYKTYKRLQNAPVIFREAKQS